MMEQRARRNERVALRRAQSIIRGSGPPELVRATASRGQSPGVLACLARVKAYCQDWRPGPPVGHGMGIERRGTGASITDSPILHMGSA